MREFGANRTQALKGLSTGIAQTHTGICEFQATSVLDEQAHAKVFFEHLQLPADCAVSDVKLLGCLTDAVQASRGFKGPEGI
ncbi:hypothetical protein PMm318_A12930 [Pseudomonas moorei]